MFSVFFFMLCQWAESLIVQWTHVIMSSLGPEKFPCYNKTLLYQDYKNNKIQRKSEIRDRPNHLVIMKVCYISTGYNESPLYCWYLLLFVKSMYRDSNNMKQKSCTLKVEYAEWWRQRGGARVFCRQLGTIFFFCLGVLTSKKMGGGPHLIAGVLLVNYTGVLQHL